VHTTLLAIVLGGGVGLMLGAMGGGGSILAVPLLVYVLGEDPHSATTTSLLVVGWTAAVAAIQQLRMGRTNPCAGLIFGGIGGASALLGAWLNRLVSGQALMCLFALLMLAVAFGMSRKRLPVDKENEFKCQDRAVRLGVTGGAVGVLTGFFGVGGGFVILPAMVLAADLPMKLAVGTSLLAIALQATWGVVGHLGLGTVAWGVTLPFLVGSIAGGLVGGRLAALIPPRLATRGFALLLALLAVYLLYRNCAAFI